MAPLPPGRMSGPPSLLRRRAFAALALAAALTASSSAVAPRALAEDLGPEGAVTAASIVAGTVAIGGTAASGQTVTAGTAGWSPPETTFSYAWSVDGTPVGSDAPTLLIDPAWVGGSLTVTVTGTAPDTTVATATSDPVQVAVGQFATAPVPTVGGPVRVGRTLTADPGTWSPAAAFTYQWRSNGAAITGATGPRFTPTWAYQGARLSVAVTGRAPGYSPVTRTSVGAVVGAGVFSAAPVPTISGARRVGAILTAQPGVWTPTAAFTYRWLRNGVLIPGATARTYQPTLADHTKLLRVRVTATRAGFAPTVRTSGATAAIVRPFAVTVRPTVTGTPRVGATLTARVGAWSPAATFSWQWRRDGVAVPGATGPTYRLVAADHQRAMTVTVTGRRTHFVPAARTSPATARIAPPPPTLRGDGTFRVGTEIPAGVYVARPAESCYWERRSTAGSDFDGIIANDFGDGQRIVRIDPSDRYFTTQDCGSWTRLMPLAAPRTSMGNGVFAVRSHIRPGLYKAPGTDGCYWARLSGFSAQFDDIIDNSFSSGQQQVRIYAGDVGFESSNCGTWTRIGD